MTCPHCVGADKLFDMRTARRELDKLHDRGPSASTARLLALLGHRGSLLDIGGGVGAIQQDFMRKGGASVTGVDASSAYLQVAGEEAERLGWREHAEFLFGDFVELADLVQPHDVVTLDRVLCCYPDVAALVSASAARARREWGVVFPKERWWTRLGSTVLNLGLRLWGSDYRSYVHSEQHVDALAAEQGLRRAQSDATWVWNVWIYERVR